LRVEFCIILAENGQSIDCAAPMIVSGIDFGSAGILPGSWAASTMKLFAPVLGTVGTAAVAAGGAAVGGMAAVTKI
jgi:hypothetical protein